MIGVLLSLTILSVSLVIFYCSLERGQRAILIKSVLLSGAILLSIALLTGGYLFLLKN